MKLDYEECSRYFKHVLKIKLLPFQEEMLKAFCEDKVVKSTRASGRTFILNGMQKYVDSLKEQIKSLDKVPYDSVPDLVIDYHFTQNAGLMSKEMIDNLKKVNPKKFQREYACS